MRAGVVIVLSLIASSAMAAETTSGADVLLRSVSGAKEDNIQLPTTVKLSTEGSIRLDDSFSRQLFTEWQSRSDLPFEVGQWVQQVLMGHYKDAAHLWTAIQAKVPEGFSVQARATWIYLLWKMNLSQTFFNEWVRELVNNKFMESKASAALEQLVSLGLDRFLMDEAIQATPEQETTLLGLKRGQSPVAATLHAWIAMRKGEKALEFLSILPNDSRLKIPLAETAALALAKKKDLAGAGKVFKTQLEPAISASQDPLMLSNYYLQLARLLYQAGAMDASEQFYEKIPSKSRDYISARQELVWVWLRKGDSQKLRGDLETLSSPIFDQRFAPEVHLVRALSNLKLCYYEAVQKDFDRFISNNREWAKKIDGALASENPPIPDAPDYFSKRAQISLDKRQAEMTELEQLGKQSIAAALPAVGEQVQWTRLRDQMTAQIELSRKTRSFEYRRQWKNQKAALAEAIRKMQFVKVEVMSQIRAYAEEKNSASIQDDLTVTKAAPLKPANDEIAFPVDGLYWPDEMFHMRSIAQNKCLQRGKK